MARARRITPIDMYKRSIAGQKCEENDWDLKIIPQTTSKLVKEYSIKMDRQVIIPDGELADRIFQAGKTLLLETGVYNMTTKRIMQVTEDEIRDAMKYAPREVILGAGKDAAHMIRRKAGGSNYDIKPIIQGGPTGAPVSEKLFLPTHISYAQEAVVDTIVNGVLSTYQGDDVTPGTPIESKAVKLEQQYVHLAAALAGRPGMGV